MTEEMYHTVREEEDGNGFGFFGKDLLELVHKLHVCPA
jgi:hypothetical protein